MKIGDLVKIDTSQRWMHRQSSIELCCGLIIGFTKKEGRPVVYWNDKFPKEKEYPSQLVKV